MGIPGIRRPDPDPPEGYKVVRGRRELRDGDLVWRPVRDEWVDAPTGASTADFYAAATKADE